MAYSLNRAEIIGNLTQDPEMRTTGSGTAVTTFSVATNQTWKDNNGQTQTKTEYHNVVAWRRLAEIIHQYARKGGKVYVDGKLQTRSWEGQDGVKRYRTEIVADNIILLDSRNSGSNNAQPAMEREHGNVTPQTSTSDDAPAPVSADAEEVSLDDLPF